jgi:hypothetical protein
MPYMVGATLAVALEKYPYMVGAILAVALED